MLFIKQCLTGACLGQITTVSIPNINIINEHFDQVMRYNIELKSKMIIVTNGLNHFYFKLDKNINQYVQEKDLIFYNK